MEKLLPIQEIPHRLKRLRESANLTQGQLAELCGMNQAQISAYEIGKNLPNLESLAILAKNLGTTVAHLVEEEEPTLAPPRQPDRREMALFIIRAIGIEGFKLDRIKQVLFDSRY